MAPAIRAGDQENVSRLSSQPEVSFIIVTYNNAGTIVACLSSIAANTTMEYEIVVVDNSPDNETALAVERFDQSQAEPATTLIKNSENIGFGRACNVGARRAHGKFLFFLNPDTRLQNDASALLADCFRRYPAAKAAGPAICDTAGRIARTCRNFPTLARIILDATGLDRVLGAYKLTRLQHQRARKVEQIMGAAMLVRGVDYDGLGGMDERFFMYFEEVDLCKRLTQAGGERWFWPEARVQHLAGVSAEAEPVRARMIYVLRESRRKYFEKHCGTAGARWLELINRLEGLQNSAILRMLWMIRRRRADREKARGFWAVATGLAPRS
jgi:N-acetylglucosaminyl-diphospho-decaprenol L-rhamnosyltransferase